MSQITTVLLRSTDPDWYRYPISRISEDEIHGPVSPVHHLAALYAFHGYESGNTPRFGERLQEGLGTAVD